VHPFEVPKGVCIRNKFKDIKDKKQTKVKKRQEKVKINRSRENDVSGIKYTQKVAKIEK